MTFYLQPLPFNQIRQRPQRRVIQRWNGYDHQSLTVNVREEDEAFLLTALVPGLKAEDLNIKVLEDVIRIEGEYSRDENQYLMRELPQGSFTRTLRLPAPIDADTVEAKIAEGILTLRLPKAESARPKKIKIKSR